MDTEILKRLKEIKIENIFFFIFIIVIIIAYYANTKEIDYFINKNETSKQEYYYITIIIFLVVVIVSGYYFYQSSKEIITNKNIQNKKQIEYNNLEFIASTLALLAALIYLYIAITDTNIDTEISL